MTPIGVTEEVVEEMALLSDVAITKFSKGDAVRRRLATCLFLYIVGVSIVTQIYPKVVLEYFNNDDAEASKFNGWLTFVSSVVQFIAVPSLSGASDVIGRRAVVGGSLALSGGSVLALGLAPNSIVAVSACQIVSGVCGAILPVSQAIIIDVSSWGKAEGGGEVTHGLGLIGAAFGLAISVGPILGGALSEFHRGTACHLSAGISLLALLSLRFYGWKETAPERKLHETTQGANRGTGSSGTCSTWRVANPFSVLKVFLESRALILLALGLFFFSLALNVYSVYYNYFDFRYGWSALDISFFFSALGVLLAFTSGVGIRFLVPKRLSEGRAVLIGLSLQAISATLYGLAPRGWMLYPVLLVTVVQYITEPCIQAVMATLVGDDRQGSLQGAVMSLRILAQGIAAPIYGQVFSFGVSSSIKQMLGVLVPGLPLFLAGQCSISALTVSWCALRKLSVRLDAERVPLAEGVDFTEQGFGLVSPCSARGGELTETDDISALRVSTFSSNGYGDGDTTSEISEPLLSGAASRNSSVSS